MIGQEPGSEEDLLLQWARDEGAQIPTQSPVFKIIWLILTILIILSLTLPWVLPYFAPRRLPVEDGLQVLLFAIQLI